MKATAIALAVSTLCALGCASFNPTPMEQVGFMDRAKTLTKGDVTVTVAVLSA